MALPVCQFVDRVGTGAQQRLDLNDGKNFSLMQGPDVRPGPDFSPPKLKRAVVNTLLVDGASIPATAYDNRIIRLPLRVKACNEEEMAEILETLHRELDRGQNILKWHPTYNFRPVYFRTFRSPDYRLDQTMEGRAELIVTLSLVAEPFGYGDYIEQTGMIYNDPAAAANGLYFEITTTEGDIPTPLWLALDPPGIIWWYWIIATRRHGTPALYWSQAEAMAQGVDTTTQPNNVAYSGAGNNFSLTTFATATMQTRLTWSPAPAAGTSVDFRGSYRLFVRVKRSDNTSDIVAQARWGNAVVDWVEGDEITIPKTTSFQLVDFGLIHIPVLQDPIYMGYEGIPLPVNNLDIFIQARRDAGAGTINWDYAVLVPADEEFALPYVPTANVDLTILDGPNEVVHGSNLTTILNNPTGSLVGSLPLVTPNQTNLYIVINGIDQNLITWDSNYTARYWPRYLYVR